MVSSEAEKLFQAFAEKRKAELPRFTPDGIPITLENKFDDAIYNYLYEYWKTNSGEYDPKKDVIPESEMNKMHPKTKNEKKFEQWLLQQYGMTNKEQREYTLKGNLESLWEIFSAADMVLFARGLPSIGKELAQLGKKAVDDVAEEVVEKTVKTEVAEEVAENTTKKEMADTTEDLSQKTVDKDDILEGSKVIERESKTLYLSEPKQGGTLNIGAGTRPIKNAYNIDINPTVEGIYQGSATNLWNITTSSQNKIIMQNPYKYDVLNPEVNRVLQEGGIIEISGGLTNGTFKKVYNMSEEKLSELGYEIVSKGIVENIEKGFTTTGKPINSTIYEIILRKNGGVKN